MIWRTGSRSVVGDCTASGAVEYATMPTRTLPGTWSRKVLAAFWAAARRSGETSSDSIEREWSVTSMIVARSIGIATVRSGFASATTSAATDARSSAIGTRGRHAGERPMARAADDAAGKRTA